MFNFNQKKLSMKEEVVFSITPKSDIMPCEYLKLMKYFTVCLMNTNGEIRVMRYWASQQRNCSTILTSMMLVFRNSNILLKDFQVFGDTYSPTKNVLCEHSFCSATIFSVCPSIIQSINNAYHTQYSAKVNVPIAAPAAYLLPTISIGDIVRMHKIRGGLRRVRRSLNSFNDCGYNIYTKICIWNININ